MITLKIKRALCPITAALLVGLVGCSSNGSGGGSGGGTFKVGAMIPLSGVSATIGTEAQQGISMAIDAVNASGDLGKTKLKPVYRDNPGTPNTAVTNFQKLVSIDHVAFSITTFSSATKAIAPLATTNKVVLLNPGASTTEFENLSPYLFSDIPLGDQQSKAMLSYSYKQLGIKKLAAIYSNDAQGSGFKSVIPKYWGSLGGDYVGDVTASTTQTDFGGVIAQMQQDKPDAVYIGMFGSGQGDLMKQAAGMGFNPVWLGSTSFANEGALKIAGAAANGTYSTQVQPADTDSAKKFVSTYQSKFGAAPSSFAQLSYSGVQILAQAIKSLQEKNKDLTGKNLQSAMLSQTFDTVNGKMKFQKDGSVTIPMSITQYKDGAFQTLGTFANGKFTPSKP